MANLCQKMPINLQKQDCIAVPRGRGATAMQSIFLMNVEFGGQRVWRV